MHDYYSLIVVKIYCRLIKKGSKLLDKKHTNNLFVSTKLSVKYEQFENIY
jgi:hypothetical protein